MKNIINSAIVVFLMFGSMMVTSCSDWTDAEAKDYQSLTESNLNRTPEYYANLRAYKKTDHRIAFGWFGFWNGGSDRGVGALRNTPDSMDIVSIWGASAIFNLTPKQIEDIRYVQQVKGTKITFTIFAHQVPEPFKATKEGVEEYARALVDSANKYGYEGIDLDYEPGFGGVGPLVGHDNKLMTAFCEELGKYFGPLSGTGRLFLIDGVPFALEKHLPAYFDYGIVQAYNSSSFTDLQTRYNDAYKKNWPPEKYVFAENFEDHWKNGGVNHRTRDGRTVPSLFGMAEFRATQGDVGGFGAYHMEYEFPHTPDYKFMRQAIQLVNPAVQP